MTGNYKDYALMWYDDPYEECVNWFWGTLGDDDTLPKEFLEGLLVQVAQIESGEVKPIPFTQDMFDRLEDLVGDIEVDLNEKLEEDNGDV
jgi:hypothetical protein